MLHQEGDDVAALAAAEAVAGEDVVREGEGVALLDLGAEHLLDPVGLLDRLDDPAAARVLLGRALEALTVLRDEEEVSRRSSFTRCTR